MQRCPKCQRVYPAPIAFCDKDGARLVPATPTAPPAPPAAGAASDQAWSPAPRTVPSAAASAAGGDYELRYMELLKRGWSVAFGGITWSLVNYVLIVMLAQALAFGLAFTKHNLLGNLVSFACFPMYAGIWLFALDLLRGQTTPLERFFEGYRRFIPLLLVGLVSAVLIILGLVLLILPGIYLIFAYQYATPLVLDQGLGFWEALETSRKKISRHWFRFFGFCLFLLLFNLLGLLCLIVGVLVTAWVSFFAIAAAYEEMFGERR